MHSHLLSQLECGENHQLECKSAAGGLPGSLWETYSSFANTEGGTILLGVKETSDGTLSIEGLDEGKIAKYQKDLWNCLQNRSKVSCNILVENNIKEIDADGKKILSIEVPPADPCDRPVYIGPDPLTGTYRRGFDGDYLCTPKEVRLMFADYASETADSKVLEQIGLDAVNQDTLKQYRSHFKLLRDTHPWNGLSDEDFLIRLKAAAKNQEGGVSLTSAGLLMFGNAYQIKDVFPDYFLDYQEKSDKMPVRWLFRLTSDDGDWSGNIHDFYFRILNRIDDDVAVPFGHRREGFRISRTNVHEALGEALANTLIHALYPGEEGIVVIKKDNKLTFSNPGVPRVTRAEMLSGGKSNPRNPCLMAMFNFLNIGERAGSGVEKILAAWKEQEWPSPEYTITYRPERVTLELETGQIVYMPGSVDLRTHGGTSIESGADMRAKDEIVMDYVRQNSFISMRTVVELCGYKSRSAARHLIETLVQKGLLERKGQGNRTIYVLPERNV